LKALKEEHNTFKVKLENSIDKEISLISRKFKQMLKQKGQGNDDVRAYPRTVVEPIGPPVIGPLSDYP